uniref:Uncharacterized protein n=1 Tax=Timema monikensis TaxID=170555 RepID=A0A7R9EG83_9NEOP|nr:unnamed protein product [Timema monikensis]
MQLQSDVKEVNGRAPSSYIRVQRSCNFRGNIPPILRDDVTKSLVKSRDCHAKDSLSLVGFLSTGRGIRRLEEEFTLLVKTWNIRIMKSVFCKTAMVLMAVIVMMLTVPTWARDERYTSKYDDMDVDHILKSDRLTDSYVHCLMDQGPCTPEGKVMKSKCLLSSTSIEVSSVTREKYF